MAHAPRGRSASTAAAPTARSVAAGVLVRVRKDGAFAAAALDAELGRTVQLDARDRALATELVYGVLRRQAWLERRLARHARRGLGGLEPRVVAVLSVAAYQVLVLTRIPAFAAVSEAVSEIRALRGERVAGFANAVLRKLAAEPRPGDDELARAAIESADPSLVAAIERTLGAGGAARLLADGPREQAREQGGEQGGKETASPAVHGGERAGGRQRLDGTGAPPLGLRVEDASARDAWLARLREARPDASFEPGAASPLAILARGAGRLVDLPGYAEGAWTSQEEGSQVVALSLGTRAGDAVLDACAGRGNKTGLLARAAGERGAVDAADLHPNKLERLRLELARVHAAVRATYPVDWSAGAGGVTGPYDRVLVDAPCSGTGTIRRRPELLLRRNAGDLGELASLQRAILARVAPLVRPGGRVVYAVCSVLREEAEDVVAGAAELGLAPAPFDGFPPRRGAGPAGQGGDGDAARPDRGSSVILDPDATTFRLLPYEHGTDGYFVASFVRVS